MKIILRIYQKEKKNPPLRPFIYLFDIYIYFHTGIIPRALNISHADLPTFSVFSLGNSYFRDPGLKTKINIAAGSYFNLE